MAHVGRQQGQFGLHVRSLAIPAEERVHREAVSQVMDAWKTAIRFPDTGCLQEAPEDDEERRTGIGAQDFAPVPEKRRVRRGQVQTIRATSGEIVLDFDHAVVRHRQQPRLVELGGTNEERALLRVVISDTESQQFSSAQAHRVEEYDSQPEDVSAQPS